MPEFTGVAFPILSVEWRDGQRSGPGIQTTDVDIVAVRVRAGNIIGLNTADIAEQMLGNAGIEGVGDDMLFAGQQAKLGPGNYQMKITRLGADRAITLVHLQVRRGLHFEPDRTAMTTALIYHVRLLRAKSLIDA
jgi:hypothetical protein